MSKQTLTNLYPEKRAFVTGAGSGLGLAFACELACEGWKVGISDINKERLDAAAAKVKEAGGIPSAFIFDVADYQAFQLAIKDFIAHNGGIDVGFNNAGIGCGGIFEDVAIETFKKVIDTNLMGVANGCHIFVPAMRQQGAGHILNVASAAAFVTAPRMTAYSTAKAGVLALSECLKSELADSQIKVSVLCPAYVRTNIGKDTIGGELERKFSQMLADSSPLSAEEVAAQTLKCMAEGKLYIVLPAEARFLWRLKRLMPERYSKIIKVVSEKRIKRLNAKILEAKGNH